MNKIAFGDWQTPFSLAQDVLAIVKGDFKSIVEPTCGKGAFLVQANKRYPNAKKIGFEINSDYVVEAKKNTFCKIEIEQGDFFDLDWEEILSPLSDPLLIVGNPPWVSNSIQGKLNTTNLPKKSNLTLKGLDALTGKSNFDISKWMILHLLEIVKDRNFTLAMLVKTSVANQIIKDISTQKWNMSGELRYIDAKLHFKASVDATLLHIWSSSSLSNSTWKVFSSLMSEIPDTQIGVVNGNLFSNLEHYESTIHLERKSVLHWRSGVKHDCSKIMELEKTENLFLNKLGDLFPVEPEYVFPLLKGSDIANGRLNPRRYVILTQKNIGQDTLRLEQEAPLLWKYLSKNKEYFSARKSRVYFGKPDFSIFGIGNYSFAPYKIAICGLYKRFSFSLLEPLDGKPIQVDDTCYFLSFENKEEAQRVLDYLKSEEVSKFFESRVFWNEKRPITKGLLESLFLK